MNTYSSYEVSDMEKYSRYINHISKYKNDIICNGFYTSNYLQAHTLNSLFHKILNYSNNNKLFLDFCSKNYNIYGLSYEFHNMIYNKGRYSNIVDYYLNKWIAYPNENNIDFVKRCYFELGNELHINEKNTERISLLELIHEKILFLWYILKYKLKFENSINLQNKSINFKNKCLNKSKLYIIKILGKDISNIVFKYVKFDFIPTIVIIE